jgi:hypothetical protein
MFVVSARSLHKSQHLPSIVLRNCLGMAICQPRILVGLFSFSANVLRKIYPGHSLVTTSDLMLNTLALPGAHSEPFDSEMVTDLFFMPLAKRLGGPLGILIDRVNFGCFKLSWNVSINYRLGECHLYCDCPELRLSSVCH